MLDQGGLCLDLLRNFSYDQVNFQAAIKILAGMLWADGNLSKEEIQFVEELTKNGFSSLKPVVWRHDLLDSIENMQEEVSKISNPRLRFLLIDLLFFAAYADGVIDEGEKRYLEHYLSAVGIKDDKVIDHLLKSRTAWYNHLKEAAALEGEKERVNSQLMETIQMNI